MAQHYGTAVIPARVAKPKDKAKVETGVLIVERWILARLRNQQFFSLQQLNEAIRNLLLDLNKKPFQKLPGCWQSTFLAVDKPALKSLPQTPYEFAEWKKARVNVDYHIEVDRHYYSVPYKLIKKQIDVRITNRTIECIYNNKRVASHIRDYRKGWHTTVKEHMPKSHQNMADWTPDRFIRWSQKIGLQTTQLIMSCWDPADSGKLIGEEPRRPRKKWFLPVAVVAAIIVTSIVWHFYQKATKPDIEPASVGEMAFSLPD